MSKFTHRDLSGEEVAEGLSRPDVMLPSQVSHVPHLGRKVSQPTAALCGKARRTSKLFRLLPPYRETISFRLAAASSHIPVTGHEFLLYPHRLRIKEWRFLVY